VREGDTYLSSIGKLLAALVLALGIASAGWFVGDGFIRGRAVTRTVTVKGVSEREVKADVALWPLRFVATNDDMKIAQDQLRAHSKEVYAFLARHGIPAEQAELRELEVTDTLANPYGDRSVTSRYIISQTIMVRSDKPDVVFAASQKVDELVTAGVVLTRRNDYGGAGPTFLFTRLNDLKPAMIAEATASARQAAEQFAKDSQAKLGGIRTASQGVFVILPRDQAEGMQEQQQLEKIVRVVSTVDYFLLD
jgi:hypothetical protein